jgi:O-antigen/teichoic acid export membrane protein
VTKGGLKLGLNEIFAQAGSFVRSIILARLISPADFGVAATFALMFSLLQMVSNLATDTLLVQAENGDDPKFQDTVHTLQAIRGAAIALALVITGAPVARLFGVADAAWAFESLALVPLIKGFAHSDMFRFQRFSRFGPSIRVNIWATLLTTAASFPLALWLRNYAVMVWVLMIQAACTTVGSHLVSSRPYRLSPNRRYFRQMFAFGWPLLVNGLLMYLLLQGDRFVIGTAGRLFSQASYSLADLALYSLVASIVEMPAMLVANVATSLFLPALSRLSKERVRFEEEYRGCSLIVCLFAALTSGPLVFAGGWLIGLIYGPNYNSAGGVIIWLAAMQAVRITRVSPTLAAIALGDTKNLMIANLMRTPSFALMLVAAAAGGPLSWIAACGFAGELLGLSYSLWRLWRSHHLRSRLCLGPCSTVAIALTIAASANSIGLAQLGVGVALATSAGIVVVTISIMTMAYPRLRDDLHALVVW